MSEDKALPGPIGEGRPFIPMRLQMADGAGSPAAQRVGAETLSAELSRSAKLSQLASVLCESAELPDGAVTFMYEGRTLDLAGTLEENGILLPGPAAMRRGARVEILFDLKHDVMSEEREREEAIKREAERASEAARRMQELEQQELERRQAAAEKLEREKGKFEEWVDQCLGVSEVVRDELLADRARLEARRELKNFVDVQNHFLTLCDDQVTSAMQNLLNIRGCSRKVLKVYKNENETLRRRYERARSLLKEGANITRNRTETQKTGVVGVEPLDFLGPLELDVNEYPMWHGTPSAAAAGGICSSGFDIAFAGAHGLAWGHGFYFADSAATSMGYAGHGCRVSDDYPSCSVMLLCRVLAGNIKSISSPPTQEQKEAFTAECLGPGGTFGDKSRYHSICGGGWAYVCAHRDQVYPAYVIIYSGT